MPRFPRAGDGRKERTLKNAFIREFNGQGAMSRKTKKEALNEERKKAGRG